MPELPEVETIKRGLEKLVVSQQIKQVEFDWPKGFPNAKNDVEAFLYNAHVKAISRRGKVLIFDLDSDYSLVVHLKMTGQLVFVSNSSQVSPLRVVGDQDRHLASLSAGPVAPGTSHRARVASDAAAGRDPSYHATRAGAQSKSSDDASAETVSSADIDLDSDSSKSAKISTTTPARVADGGAAPASREISDFREEGADRPTGPAPSDLRGNSSRISDDGSGEDDTETVAAGVAGSAGRDVEDLTAARFGGGHPTDSLINQLPDKSTRVTLTFASGDKLYFNDQRKFGWMRLLPTIELLNINLLKQMGPEPLSDEFTKASFTKSLSRRSRSSIKAAILDQKIVAGVGNIYADEALWGAKIHPASLVADIPQVKLNTLRDEIRYVLQLSIDHKGSTDKNYVDAEGKRGSYLQFARVFRREGLACSRCGSVIEKIRVAGRGTHICPKEQRL